MKHTLLLGSFCILAAAAQAQDITQRATVEQSIDAGQSVDLKAFESISARNVVKRSASASYTAGKAIMLTPGFEARAGSVFQATIGKVEAKAVEPIGELLVSATPNPFDELTTIEYSLPEAGKVKHTLTDERGAILRQNDSDGVEAAGKHRIGVTGTNLSTGIYLYQIQTGNRSKTIRLLKQ
jgi:hypothetical protein